MRLLSCRGCESKDAEIHRLEAQLERLTGMVERAQTRLAELAEPGLAMRVARTETPEKFRAAAPPKKVVRGFPGYGPEPGRQEYVVEEPFPIPAEEDEAG